MSSTFSPTPPPSGTLSTGPPTATPTDNGNNSLTSSASLYLYTFLATLVLLLVVSAAIVVRSFILRRRHRTMIEEALRNGTLLSPTIAGGYGLRPRVDLSKKPKIWDAWVEKSEQPTSGRSREKEWYWDMMKPFSAVYAISFAGNTPGNNDDRGLSSRQGTLTPRQSIRVRMGSAARHAGRALAYYVSTRPSMNNPNGSSPPSSTQLAMPTVLSHLESGNATVKVAVLIAMPRKPSIKDSSSSANSRPLSSSSSTSPPPFPPPIGQTGNDDEEQLPHLEVGITEVRVVSNSDDSTPHGKGIMQQ